MKGTALRRIFGTALALALALTLAAPATAQMSNLDQLGDLAGVRNMNDLVKQALRGEAPEGVTVEKLDNGLTKIAIALRPDSPVFRQKLAKNLINCALTVDLFEPDLFADTVSFDVAPIDDFEYSAGWVTINTSANDIVAASSIKTKGPGADLNTAGDLDYTGNAFNLFFVTFDGWGAGLHSIDAKVKGAKPGKLKGNFCAGCT